MDYTIDFQKTVESQFQKRTIIVFTYQPYVDSNEEVLGTLHIIEHTNPRCDWEKENKFEYAHSEFWCYSPISIDTDTLIQSIIDDDHRSSVDWNNP